MHSPIYLTWITKSEIYFVSKVTRFRYSSIIASITEGTSVMDHVTGDNRKTTLQKMNIRVCLVVSVIMFSLWQYILNNSDFVMIWVCWLVFVIDNCLKLCLIKVVGSSYGLVKIITTNRAHNLHEASYSTNWATQQKQLHELNYSTRRDTLVTTQEQ